MKKEMLPCRYLRIAIIIFGSLLLSACMPKVDRLINKLSSSDEGTRRRAAESLGDLRDPKAVDPLIHALGDDDYMVPVTAAVALGKIGDPRAVDALISFYLANDHRGQVELEKSIEEAIIAIGEPAIKVLIPKLANVGHFESHERDDEVELVSYALEKIGNPAINDLVSALENEQLRVGVSLVLKNIGYIPPEEASRVFYWIGLEDDNELIKMGPSVVEHLIFELENLEGDSDSRVFAARVLGDISDPAAVEPLISCLNDLEDEYDVRTAAAIALGKIGDTESVIPLVNAFRLDIPFSEAKQGNLFKEAAQNALIEIGDPAVPDLVIGLLEPMVGHWCAGALIEIGGPQVIENMTDVIENSNGTAYTTHAMILVEANERDASILLPYLVDEETVWVYDTIIAYGLEGSEDELITALEKFGSVNMAESYLNCGNAKLEAAGYQWASNEGYFVTTTTGSSVKWGGGK